MNRLLSTVAILFFSLAVASQAYCSEEETPQEQDSSWSFSLSVGSILSPSYLGDDEYQLSMLPDVSVSYEDRFSFSFLGGLSVNAIHTERWKLGAIAKYDFGRDETGENPLSAVSSDTDDLRGLGDIDGGVELGGFVEYTYFGFSFRSELRQALGGHEGLVGEVSIKYNTPLTLGQKMAFLSLGPEVTFGDSDYHSAFFGISRSQSLRSGLKEHDAKAGVVSTGIHASFVLPLNQQFSLIAFGGVDLLAPDVSDSPLVSERGSDVQGLAGLLLSYRFSLN